MALLRVLILGGYGTFGRRLAELLSAEPRLELLIAGRSEPKARATVAALAIDGGAALSALVLDREGDVAGRLAEIRPDIVVDATGPYQLYGAEPYRVVEACLALGLGYLDLADGADFVSGIGRFDAEARRRGVFVLSGVSSFPVLTAAVVRRLAAGMDDVDAISAGIAPSPYAGIGLNVIRAIASYAGQPVFVRRNGADATGHALTETMRATVAPPGAVPLSHALFALVDVPDNRVLPRHWPHVRSVWIGVAPKPETLFLGLIGLSWLVRLGLLRSLSGLARLFHWSCNTLRWGEDRGAMFVAVEGRAGERRIERSWHMVAESQDGPLIPSMAAAAVVMRCLAGDRPAPGARDAVDDLDLGDYEALFRGRRITAGIREPHGPLPLYHAILGGAWEKLPPAVRTMHDLVGDKCAEGRADIEGGSGFLARLVRALFGFPKAGRNVPVSVRFAVKDGVETWRRSFAGRPMSSRQHAGTGNREGLVVERFGPFAFGLTIVADAAGLELVTRRWSAFGLRLPLRLAPWGTAREWEEDGRFRFDVSIAHPLTGPIVRYSGWLR